MIVSFFHQVLSAFRSVSTRISSTVRVIHFHLFECLFLRLSSCVLNPRDGPTCSALNWTHTWAEPDRPAVDTCLCWKEKRTGHFCTAARHVPPRRPGPVLVEGRGHQRWTRVPPRSAHSHVRKRSFPYARNTSIKQLSNTCHECYSHIMDLTPFCQPY